MHISPFLKLTILFFYPLLLIAQFGNNINFLGEALISGGFTDVAVSGKHAYALNNYGMMVFDISDKDTMELVSSVATPGFATKIHISGSYAFIADERYGLIIVDIGDPSYPYIIGTFGIGNYQVTGIYTKGEYAYLAGRSKGIYVLNISNVSEPTLVTQYSPGFDAFGIYITDTLAFIADYWDGIRALSISQPESISEVSFLELPDRMVDIFVSGTFAYVAALDSGMRVINISNPHSMLEVGSFNLGNAQARRLFVNDTIAFIAYDNAGLQMVNISNASNPVFVGSFPTYNARGIFVEDSFAYLTRSTLGLSLIHVEDPATPVLKSNYESQGRVRAVQKSGNHVYVTGDQRLFAILDVNQPQHPDVIYDWLTSGQNGMDICVRDTIAYIACHSQGLQIASVSDPTTPYLISGYDTTFQFYGVDVSEEYAYLAGGEAGLRILDISSPAVPREIGYYDSVTVLQVDVDGSMAYLACNEFGLCILDISNPANPVKVNSITAGGWASDVMVSGEYVFLAWSDFSMINVSNPYHPNIVTEISEPGVPKGIYYEAPFAYLVTENGVFVYDVSDTTSIKKVGSYDLPGHGYNVYVENDLLYVADYEDFCILQFTRPSGLHHTRSYINSNYHLSQNYPNPFNPSTTIEFDLPKTSNVTLKIFNILGEEITTLVSDRLNAGSFNYEWTASDLASGVYLYRLEAGDHIETRKMVLMR
jgi:hypothetical protein